MPARKKQKARKVPSKKKPGKLTHLDARGQARMVDVGAKAVTGRVAVASVRVRMKKETLALATGGAKKGDVLAAARIAGIAAAKKTGELIPLCHPLPLDSVSVDITPVKNPPSLLIEAAARTTAKTGVEMEAMTAASVAALTIYDMCKAADRAMVIEDLRLEYKSGGKSGTYRRKGYRGKPE